MAPLCKLTTVAWASLDWNKLNKYLRIVLQKCPHVHAQLSRVILKIQASHPIRLKLLMGTPPPHQHEEVIRVFSVLNFRLNFFVARCNASVVYRSSISPNYPTNAQVIWALTPLQARSAVVLLDGWVVQSITSFRTVKKTQITKSVHSNAWNSESAMSWKSLCLNYFCSRGAELEI